MYQQVTPLKQREFSQDGRPGPDSIGAHVSRSNDKLYRAANPGKNNTLLVNQSMSPEMAKVIRHIQPLGTNFDPIMKMKPSDSALNNLGHQSANPSSAEGSKRLLKQSRQGSVSMNATNQSASGKINSLLQAPDNSRQKNPMFAQMGNNIISGVSVDNSSQKDNSVLSKKRSMAGVTQLNNSTDPSQNGQVQLHSVLKQHQQKDNFLTQQQKLYNSDSKKFSLMFTNQNQLPTDNQSKFNVGPVKATMAAVEGSTGKMPSTYNVAQVQGKKVTDIAECLGMRNLAPQKPKQSTSSSLEPKTRAGEMSAEQECNTFYPQLKTVAGGPNCPSGLAPTQLKSDDSVNKSQAFFHQKSKSGAKPQSFDLNASSNSKVMSSANFASLKCSRLLDPEPKLIAKLLESEHDERYRYLLKHGKLHHIEADSFSLYVELPQIPNILIIYRRPKERLQNPEKIQLDSRGLKHIPLLEGEERIKYLNLQNNEILKIENLVSLPNLHFLDLSQNKLTELGACISKLAAMRVLILSKNLLSALNGPNGIAATVSNLMNLDMLDLHDNRIQGALDLKLLNFQNLQNLRILNLCNNQLESIDLNCSMKSLTELNLRNNRIKEIKADGHELKFDNLVKLYLSNNQIKDFDQLEQYKNNKSIFGSVKDLTIENNPIEKDANFANTVKEMFPFLSNNSIQKLTQTGGTKGMVNEVQIKDSKVIHNTNLKCFINTQAKDEPAKMSGLTAAKRKAQENTVIKIIQKEWDRETERLDLKKNGQYAKNQANAKNLGDKSLVQSGHAEIESNRILYIYGNALEVLARSEFYDVVEEMHLTYVRFDLIVYHPNLDKLRKFTKLKKLVLSHNYLNSFILLSKIECVQSLDQLFVYDNEILNTVALKSFVIYRFQHIQEFNGMLINEHDKKIAKTQFQLFDKILSIQNIFTRKPPSMQTSDPVKRQEFRQVQKKNQEFAGVHCKNLLEGIVEFEDHSAKQIEKSLEIFVRRAVQDTTEELLGENDDGIKWLEKQMKKSVQAPQNN